MNITEREREVLGELDAANRSFINIGYRDGWVRPMDCGGSNGSHHGATLQRLLKKGLVDRKGWRGIRRTNWYMINDAGRACLQS